MWSIQRSLMLLFIAGVVLASPAVDLSQETGEFEELRKSGEFSDSGESVETVESLDSLQTVTVATCRPGCPRIFDPICAMDEENVGDFRYFHNMCLLEYDRCRRGKAWKPTQMLQCLTNVDPTLRDDCLRACPFNYDPVCASNGEYVEVFGNQCIFGMENCLASGKWSVVRGEVCGL